MRSRRLWAAFGLLLLLATACLGWAKRDVASFGASSPVVVQTAAMHAKSVDTAVAHAGTHIDRPHRFWLVPLPMLPAGLTAATVLFLLWRVSRSPVRTPLGPLGRRVECRGPPLA